MHRPFSFGKLYTAERKPGAGAWRCKWDKKKNKTVYAVLFVIVPFALDHLNIFSCDSVYQSVHIINAPTPQAG